MAVNTFPRMNQLEEEQIELPPGFRFHPTDEELITHYLTQKVVNSSFHAIAIGEADLNKSEPWDLPGRAKMGEKEWYFFCIKDRKYPTGLRTNRATESGYWKATGKDKEILRGKRLVGMKKTLVFYGGRAPKGEKSNWVMHEYRLEGKYPVSDHLLKTTKTEWVICRIFNKSSGDKRTHISELLSLDQKPLESDRNSPALPPLMDYSHPPYAGDARAARVTCFSNPYPMAMAMALDETKPYADMVYAFKPPHHFSSSSSSTSSNPSRFLPPTPFAFPNPPPAHPADSFWMPGNNIVRLLLENPASSSSLRQVVNPKVEFPQYTGGFSQVGVGGNNCLGDEDHQNPSASDDPIDLESLWNY